jgi:TFIIS helical bundle-like domain
LRNTNSEKETKIGKVIKRISLMKIENEPANVVQRASVLLEKWRMLLPIGGPVVVAESVVQCTTESTAMSVEGVEAEEAKSSQMDNLVVMKANPVPVEVSVEAPVEVTPVEENRDQEVPKEEETRMPVDPVPEPVAPITAPTEQTINPELLTTGSD